MDLKALLAHGNSLEITDHQAQRLENANMEHFAKLCKYITPLNAPNDRYLQDSDDDNCFTLNSTRSKTPETQIIIGHTPAKVDSGASVNIMEYLSALKTRTVALSWLTLTQKFAHLDRALGRIPHNNQNN